MNALTKHYSARSGASVRRFVAGQGRDVVLLHGIEGWDRNLAFAEALSKNARVHMIEHLWFGHSDTPPDCMNIADIAYLHLDYLKSEGLNDAVLVGGNFGAWLAAEMAIRSTQRIGSVVLMNAFGIKIGSPTEPDIADLLQMTFDDAMPLVYCRPSQHAPVIADLDDELAAALVNNLRAAARFGWQPYMHNPGLKNWLHRIDVPTHVVWGDHDAVVSMQYGRAFASLIPGAGFLTIEGAGLLPQIENPDALLEIVRPLCRAEMAADMPG